MSEDILEMYYDCVEQLHHGEDEIARLTQRVRELEEANRWIPVSERDPKVGHFYQVILTTGISKNIGRGTILFSRATGWSNSYGHVTHWRENLPLPEEKE